MTSHFSRQLQSVCRSLIIGQMSDTRHKRIRTSSPLREQLVITFLDYKRQVSIKYRIEMFVKDSTETRQM